MLGTQSSQVVINSFVWNFQLYVTNNIVHVFFEDNLSLVMQVVNVSV